MARSVALRTQLSDSEEQAFAFVMIAGVLAAIAEDLLGVVGSRAGLGVVVLAIAGLELRRRHVDRSTMKALARMPDEQRRGTISAVEDKELRAELGARWGMGGEARDARETRHFRYPGAGRWLRSLAAASIGLLMVWVGVSMVSATLGAPRFLPSDLLARGLASGVVGLGIGLWAVYLAVRHWRIGAVRIEVDEHGLRADRGVSATRIAWEDVQAVKLGRGGVTVRDGHGTEIRAHRHLRGIWNLARTIVARAPASATVETG